jgi:hypothetical protein
MRPLVLALVLAAALNAAAQSAARPLPPGTRALDEPPPLPPATSSDAALQPQVTERTTESGDVVMEYRLRGKVYMQRVKPKNGPAYVLMDHKGDGTFTRQDNTLDNGVRVPQWVLLEF